MSETPYRYTAELAGQIEVAWQDRWEQRGTYHAPNPAGPWADPEGVAAHSGGHLLVLDMFPYPSGAGLHVGHPLGYIATDVFARFNRMLGKNVLHCLGYDAFGLPAEQYAVQTGQHPRKTTEDNIVIMARQLRRLGLGHDDRRAIQTIDPDYYRWTQWIFTQIYNAWYDADAVRPDGGTGRARPIAELEQEYRDGTRPLPGGEDRAWDTLSATERAGILDASRLAYTSEAPVNWCPGLGTVLSNEEVTNEGRSERGNFPVFKRNLRQWMMRITAYADRLADDLDRVEWPEKVKIMQRNWIGRSHGAKVTFPIVRTSGDLLVDSGRPDAGIEVFTTRPDTLFGATFMVLAPEHPLVDALVPAGGWPEGTKPAWTGGADTPAQAVAAYRLAASRKNDIERQSEGKDKTGVFTGGWATNPVTGTQVPGVHRRLRAHGLRHRRDHGRARTGRARLGLRDRVRPADRPHRAAVRGARREHRLHR
jgi:leucyl-tRNA synthetase